MRLISVVLFILAVPISVFSQSTNTKRTAGVSFSLPWLSSYHYYDYELSKPASKTGFAGIGIGGFYAWKRSKLSLNAAATSDLPAPIGPIDYGSEGIRTSIGTYYVEANYQYEIFRKAWLVGGINFVNYRYKLIDNDSTDASFTRNDGGIGITAGVEYAFRKWFSVAAFYRPALLNLDRKQYHHLITLDLKFNIAFWKRE